MDIDIIWKGEARMLPGLGFAVKDDKLTVPRDIGLSFIKQGLADAAAAHGNEKATTVNYDEGEL